MSDKYFDVTITDTLTRCIGVIAESEEKAYNIAEQLCDNGTVKLDGSDFAWRNVDVTESDTTTNRHIYTRNGLLRQRR